MAPLVCTGSTSRGLHCLRREGVVQGDVVKAVNFSGPPCPPVCQRGVVFGAVQGIVDSCPLRVGINSNEVFAVALTQTACVGRAWDVWSSSPRAVRSKVAVPPVVMKRCPVCGICTWSGVRRCVTSIVVTPGRIFFQSMLPVGNRHVVTVHRVWFPSPGSW